VRARSVRGRVSLIGLAFLAVAVRGVGAQQAAPREPMNTEVRAIDGEILLSFGRELLKRQALYH
jgi:hypothetical protein